MARYYEETPCEHGLMLRHCEHGDTTDHLVGEVRLGACAAVCSGGSRRELEDVEIVGWMKDSWGLPVVGYFKNREPFKDEDQRFLVIPLSGDTE